MAGSGKGLGLCLGLGGGKWKWLLEPNRSELKNEIVAIEIKSQSWPQKQSQLGGKLAQEWSVGRSDID